jgi:hypothetical protein
LTRALRLAWRVQGLIRLTTDRALDPDAAPAAMRTRLAMEVARATGAEPDRAIELDPAIDFGEAETILDAMLAASRRRYDEIVGVPFELLSVH